MSVTFMELREGETGPVVTQLVSASSSSHEVRVLDATTYVVEYKSNLRVLLRGLMKLVQESKNQRLVFVNVHLWLVTSSSSSTEKTNGQESDDDSDDIENDFAQSGSNSSSTCWGSVISLLRWFRVHSGCGSEMVFLFECQVPKRFRYPWVRITRDLSLEVGDHEQSKLSSITLFDQTYSLRDVPSSAVIGITGPHNSGKTRALRALPPATVWLHVHEIVHCELGETTRIVRSKFVAASGRRPSVVVLDDADLVLGSHSNRVVREITEEIERCLEEFCGVFFVHAERDKKSVPATIRDKTFTWIDRQFS